MDDIQYIKKEIDKLIDRLRPFHELINCHMVDVLTKNHWKNYIPEVIRNEVNSLADIHSAIELFWSHHTISPDVEIAIKHKNLLDFLKLSNSHHLDKLDYCLNIDQLIEKLQKQNISYEAGLNLKLEDFMKKKKNHEIEITSSVVATLANQLKNGVILDVGDGKGYLSSRLSLEYHLDVLGIDGNPSNSEQAEKRNKKLKKSWNGIVKREATKANQIIKTPSIESSSYKTASKMIFSDTNLLEMVDENFPAHNFKEYGLAGLHTCGNLAAASLKIYSGNEKIKMLVNIGCCYHLLKEEFVEDIFFNQDKLEENAGEIGFPMSFYLKDKKYGLGRNARMLAAQSIDRVLEVKELPHISLFYRALFEKLLNEKHNVYQHFRLGKIKFSNFYEYFRKAIKKCNLESDLSLDEVEEILNKHEEDKQLINLYYLIRLSFAPIIESLILIDRYLFLKESCIDNSYLVKLFNPVESPRCYSLVSFK